MVTSPQKKLKLSPGTNYVVGTYKIRRKGKPVLTCTCVTMIDPATGWFELQQIPNQRSDTVSNVVEQEWPCRYPWPTQIIYDCGGAFIGT